MAVLSATARLAGLATVVPAAAAPPARTTAAAEAGLVVACSGPLTQTYSPGLLITPRVTTYKGKINYNTCTGDPDLTSGTYTEQLTYSASCSANGGKSEATIKWNGNNGSSRL